ncbi:MAG: hypothetical protein ABNH19_04760 [Dokdonia sp.]|jgi:hypothetical protein
MPKPYTFPTLYNEALQIHISKLKDWGYLDPKQIKSGTLNWSRNGNPTGSISIQANTQTEQQYIELDYKFKDEPRNYKVILVSIPSNLGKGTIWYFLCPETGKRCRKLYSIGGYFLHRTAFRGCMYDSQTKSKKWREMEILFGSYFDSDKYYEQLYSKHFKKFYNGKPTKKYLRLMKLIQKAERIEIDTLLKRY